MQIVAAGSFKKKVLAILAERIKEQKALVAKARAGKTKEPIVRVSAKAIK